jgi:hypothetical protein
MLQPIIRWLRRLRSPLRRPAPQCPNCLEEHRGKDGCLLELLIGALQERRGAPIRDSELLAIYERVDPDTLWALYGAPGVGELEALLDQPAAPATA